MSNSYSLQVVCKPWATFRNLVDGVDLYSSDFTVDDFVISLAGLDNRNLLLRDLSTLANKCFHTNLIVCTLPAKYKGVLPFNRVDIVNKQILDAVERLQMFSNNIDVLELHDKFDRSNYISGGPYLNKFGLRKLSDAIIHCLIEYPGNNHCNNNLVYIACNNECISLGNDDLVGNSNKTSGDQLFETDISVVIPLDNTNDLSSGCDQNFPVNEGPPMSQ